jgi:hypothetical protein
MSNDLRVGLLCGVGCVLAVAVLFFQKEPPPQKRETSRLTSETPSPATASIPAKPLTRPLSNPIP